MKNNFKKPFKEPKFTKTSLGKRDYFKSKDGYIFFNGGFYNSEHCVSR